MPPAALGITMFLVVPTGTSLGPTSCMSAANCSRPAGAPTCDIFGPPKAFIWSRKPLTMGSSGMHAPCELGMQFNAAGRQQLVDGLAQVGVETVLGDVVQEDAHREPEAGALHGALGFERRH